MNKTVPDRVLQVVSDVLNVPMTQLSLKSSADRIESWDSLGIIHMATALEAEFRISLSPDEVSDMRSVQAILKILDEKQAQ